MPKNKRWVRGPNGTIIFVRRGTPPSGSDVPPRYRATSDPFVFELALAECEYRGYKKASCNTCGASDKTTCSLSGERIRIVPQQCAKCPLGKLIEEE